MTEQNSIIWNGLDEVSLNEYTLIVPSVAVGNVGQLSCDLIISSLYMTKVASVYSPAFIPVLGYNPYNLQSSKLSSCCELYLCKIKKIAVLQFRAPLVFKYAIEFLEHLANTIKKKQVKDVIILSSSHAHEKKMIQTSPFRFMTNDKINYEDKLNSLNIVEHLEPNMQIFGGGFASLFYQIVKDQEIPCLLLFKYCSEGDNIPDAHEMVNTVNSLLNIDEEMVLVQPASWKLLFGRPPPQDIY